MTPRKALGHWPKVYPRRVRVQCKHWERAHEFDIGSRDHNGDATATPICHAECTIPFDADTLFDNAAEGGTWEVL